ncbi:MAG TPA: antibiotic biosynthesis monooxygenase [Cyclobacteriaceae bacterium]|nr:antibiotic biosynthesis monooxygenase [Cyclobacteriaceae bacterium]
MYVVVWKYKVRPADRIQFEAEYGHGGAWVSLFRGSKGYVGSKLYAGTDNHYLLIDAWDTRKSYENFLEAKQVQYQHLSDQFKYLYAEEIRIGDFHELNEALSSIL